MDSQVPSVGVSAQRRGQTMTSMMSVQLSTPPPALMRMVNPLVRRVLTSRVLAARIGTVSLVQVRGRRTGKVLRIPMGLHDIDGVLTAFTRRTWRLNFTGGVPVTVVRRSERREGEAVLVEPTRGQVGAALRAALDNGASPFDLGLKIARGFEPTVLDLDTAGLSMIQFVFDGGFR
ncbi:hypothetical protein QRX50_35255 [Amycolatopsis carbonis]|uniref:DUF385 domain-containing protein n=1 Tax=Amycolatopsis carbonis TaxID=715471 RepID=A0A9Y2MQ10_9PSEU|nr:hypothetical protein [Amycolatopsis sp. 2-15]WIX76675.1 hypothetical protein QRX50_35255 [Amycolatopsis sp. 2-15]